MAAKRLSLAKFAEQRPPGVPGTNAWLPSIPEFEECVEAYRAGVAPIVIREWLCAPPPDGCGYSASDATRNRVERWLAEKVERPS